MGLVVGTASPRRSRTPTLGVRVPRASRPPRAWRGNTPSSYLIHTGTAARVMLPDLSTPDNAFARVASEALPPGITGLVLAAALAAVMSTASAGLLASSTLLANDVYAGFVARGDHNRVLVNRVTALLVGVVTLVISLIVSDVVGALTVAYDLLSGALFVPIVGALFWRRAT